MFFGLPHQYRGGRRSREGAWIEIVAVDKSKVGDCGRSREGAWIEI